MNRKILVAYASKGGATAGIAQAVAQRLQAGGADVEVLPVTVVHDVSLYSAVVIGSAIHSGQWLPEALAFIERHHTALRQMPTATFQVCMLLAAKNPKYRSIVPNWLAPIHARLHPVSEASFAGALWPSRYSKLSEKLGLHIFLAAIRCQAGDYRNWDEIRAWADTLGPQLCCEEKPCKTHL